MHPYGFCKKIQAFNVSRPWAIHAKSEKDVIFIDSYVSDQIRVIEQPNAYIEIRKPYHVGTFYKMSYQLHDDSLLDGKSCRDYEKVGSSYGECVQEELIKQLLVWFNCIPPWFYLSSTNYTELQCLNDTAKTSPTDGSIRPEHIEQLNSLVNNRPMSSLKVCLKPCKSVKIRIARFFKTEKWPVWNYLYFESDPEVLVYTKVYSYTIFNLIVDLGSSLG